MENKDEIMFEYGIFGCYDISFKGHTAVGEVQNIFFLKNAGKTLDSFAQHSWT